MRHGALERWHSPRSLSRNVVCTQSKIITILYAPDSSGRRVVLKIDPRLNSHKCVHVRDHVARLDARRSRASYSALSAPVDAAAVGGIDTSFPFEEAMAESCGREVDCVRRRTDKQPSQRLWRAHLGKAGTLTRGARALCTTSMHMSHQMAPRIPSGRLRVVPIAVTDWFPGC